MDAATLQSRVYAGYAKAATRVGFIFDVYRPLRPPASAPSPHVALSPLNKVASVSAAFTSANQTGFPFNKPNDYKNVEWSGLFDASKCQVGDYLSNATQGTYFIAALQHLLPPLCIECANVFSVMRTTTTTQVGAVGYGGVSPANETEIVSGFPGAMQWARQGVRPIADMPSDIIRKGEWFFFMPAIPGVTLKERDIIADDQGRRFLAMSVYLSELGYKILAEYL